MGSAKYSWLAAPSLKGSWLVAICTLWVWLGIYIYRSPIRGYLDARLSYPVNFFSRDLVGRSVTMHESLKIYGIDDSTYALMQGAALPVDTWTRLLANIAANKPRAIVIDGMFSKSDVAGRELQTALSRLSGTSVPIYVGTFLTPQTIAYRDKLALEGDAYRLDRLLGDMPEAQAVLPPMANRTAWHLYGPDPSLRSIFSQYGHISYEGQGRAYALMRLNEQQVLPHLSLRVADNLRIQDGVLYDGATPIPVDHRGEMVLNFMPPTEFYNHVYSLKGLLKSTFAEKKIVSIAEGDVVFIIPMLFTGNTDFKSTPYGIFPGGMVVATILNGVLTKQWLKPIQGGEALIVMAAVAAAFVAFWFSAAWFWGVFGALIGVGFLFSQYLFSAHNIVLPWLYPASVFLGTGVSLFALKTWVSERKAQALKQAFEGSIPEENLRSLMRRPEKVNFEARERVVSIVFIDVVGFSLLAENMVPRAAFDSLKSMLGRLGETVYKYGGVIDKTLGDGLLCYFGYRIEDDEVTSDHAEKALHCAIEIQKENLQRNLDAAAAGEHVYPLRIGINTASCYIGDLSSGDHIDFTVVGNGVNFAKRLEGAAEMHSVLMGATTYDLVRGAGLPPEAMTKRLIRIKHHSELVEAFAFDPFYDDPATKKLALEAFRKCVRIERVDQRWPVSDPSQIPLTTDFGPASLVNFSHNGFSVKCKDMLARGTMLTMQLDSADGTLKRLLLQAGLRELIGEVRWGYDDGDGFVHGVMVHHLSDEQSHLLVDYLCMFAFGQEDKTFDGKNVS